MTHLSRAIGLLAVLAMLGAAAIGQTPEPANGRFDPRKELQEFEPGLRVFPLGSGGDPYDDPAGLEAHLTPPDDPDVELVYPCGVWSEVPSGKYLFWIEGGWRMSPHAGFFGHDGQSQTIGDRLGPAGRVALPPREVEQASGDLVLELLQADTPREGKSLWWEIVRRKPVREVGEGLLMPAGRVVGALLDRKKRRFVALSRPFEVASGRTVEVPLQRPAGRAYLMVRLQRDRYVRAKTIADLGAALALQQGDGERPPDVTIETSEHVHGIWYDLSPGRGELRAEANGTFLVPRQLDLAPGRIERVTGDLDPGPALTVEVDLPAAVRDGPLALEVRRLPGGEVRAKKRINHRQTFEGLPPALLEVELQTRLGPFAREVDLRSGKDGYVLLKPELVTLQGTVYRGDEGHPATLTFSTAGGVEVEATADEEGAYEAVLLEPPRSVSIELAGVRQEPYFEVFWTPIDPAREKDFHLSDAAFAVKVLDALTRQGIAGASVMIRNVYTPEEPAGDVGGNPGPGGPPARAARPGKREQVIAQQASTDEKGVASLPPLRPGSLELRAAAEGYLAMRRPVQAQVLDGKTDQVFEVLLEPLGATARLRLLLPDGAPAAGAEVSLVDSLAAGHGLYSGRANGDGLVELPREPAGVALVKHPGAAFLVRAWRPGEDEGEVMWDLPMAAGRPLTVQVQDASGREAAPNAELALWIAGHRLSGAALAWLTGSPPLADARGSWTGARLPRGPVAVLAWGRGVRSEAAAGSLDAQATAVGFPWPDPVEVRALE